MFAIIKYIGIWCLACTSFQDSKIYFEDEQGKFKIWQVGSFLEKYKKIDTDVGQVEVFSFYYEPASESEDPNFLYLINYMEYTDNEAVLDSLQVSLYDDTLDTSVEGLDGKLQYSTNVKINGLDGRLSRIVYKDEGAVVKSKMVLNKNRFYFVQVYTTADHSLNSKMDEFLNSFSLIST